MTAETDLSTLLNNLTPVASDETYVFVSAEFARLPVEVFQHAKGMFKEMEGTTFILEQQYAESLGLSYEGRFCCITCEVHSSLEAVGMTAAMTTALGEAGISANVVAAYFHDHIFVPADKVTQAINTLNALSNQE